MVFGVYSGDMQHFSLVKDVVKNRKDIVETMWYSTVTTPYGVCLVASTSQGICCVVFADSIEMVMADMSERFPQARRIELVRPEHLLVHEYIRGVVELNKISLHLFGTAFQLRVWQELLNVKHGTTCSYGSIATALGDKKQSRAVGTAIGNNPIGYLIPCHRVLTSTGAIGGYRWGIERKRSMLARETR